MSISLSTITPVYSGEDYLERLFAELQQLRDKWRIESAPLELSEVIFVDDGSIDSSAAKLAELERNFPWVVVITLSRNYGQHAATIAGICHSSSDWIVTLDEDLQHKPLDIEKMLKRQVETNADVIYARPLNSVHGNSWRDKSSRAVKRLAAKLTSTPQITLFNSFRLIRGSIGRAAASSSSSQTYLDIAISWFTKSCHAVDIDLRDERFTQRQQSGYGLIKLVRHARRLMLSSEVDIASAGLVLGIGSVFAAFIVGLFALVQKIVFPDNVEIAGWASLITVITFFSGIIISILCVLLEYINVFVLNSLGRPTFFTVDRAHDKQLRDWFARESK